MDFNPNISEFSIPGSMEIGVNGPTVDRQALMGQLKHNLQAAQARMIKYADKKRTKRVLAPGDMVYLKLQP